MSVNVSDSAGASTRIAAVNLVLPTLQETGGATSRASVFTREVVSDVAGVRAVATAKSFMVVQQLAGVTSSASPQATLTANVTDTAGARSKAIGLEASALGLTDTAAATARVLSVSIATALRDTAGVTSRALPTSASTRSVSDVAGAFSRAQVIRRAYGAATAGVAGQATATSKQTVVARSTAGATSAATVFKATLARVSSVAGVFARALPQANVVAVVRDVAYAYSRASTEGSAQDLTDVWTADMRSWGMSRYVGYRVTDFTNMQFGIAADGVYGVNGQMAQSYIETPDRMLSAPTAAGKPRATLPERKHINYVYTYSAHDKPLVVTVTADYQGQRLERQYTQDNRSSDKTRAVRCTVGRGFVSNYIKLRVGGEPFDLSHCEAEITPTKRRI